VFVLLLHFSTVFYSWQREKGIVTLHKKNERFCEVNKNEWEVRLSEGSTAEGWSIMKK
jgi:hypothetical protein